MLIIKYDDILIGLDCRGISHDALSSSLFILMPLLHVTNATSSCSFVLSLFLQVFLPLELYSLDLWLQAVYCPMFLLHIHCYTYYY